MIRLDHKYDYSTAKYILNGKVISNDSRYKRYGYRLDKYYLQWPYCHGPILAPKVLSTWSK